MDAQNFLNFFLSSLILFTVCCSKESVQPVFSPKYTQSPVGECKGNKRISIKSRQQFNTKFNNISTKDFTSFSSILICFPDSRKNLSIPLMTSCQILHLMVCLLVPVYFMLTAAYLCDSSVDHHTASSSHEHFLGLLLSEYASGHIFSSNL